MQSSNKRAPNAHKSLIEQKVDYAVCQEAAKDPDREPSDQRVCSSCRSSSSVSASQHCRTHLHVANGATHAQRRLHSGRWCSNCTARSPSNDSDGTQARPQATLSVSSPPAKERARRVNDYQVARQDQNHFVATHSRRSVNVEGRRNHFVAPTRSRRAVNVEGRLMNSIILYMLSRSRGKCTGRYSSRHTTAIV